jgi:hypothetical protein
MGTDGPGHDARAQHWDGVYARKRDDEVSWFEPRPEVSLAIIARCGEALRRGVIDVGAGASRLVDGLLAQGVQDLTALDVAAAALDVSRARLGARAAEVRWLVGDVLALEPERSYGVWHDRAVFHFLTRPEERAAYRAVVERAVGRGGQAVLGAFAPDGPPRCSGLEVVRYDAAALASALGPSFELREALRHEHVTPGGGRQPFTFVRLERR